MVAVIGTRKYTDYGQRLCEDLIEGLKGEEDTLIISGLAHGIDTIAHKSALKNNLSTIGVLGHGLDRIYPATNKNLSKEMQEHGGLLSEFPSNTLPDKSNFPMRNRIVAGISDVTVVVESDISGGALITARIASSYNRDVAAFPGRVHDNKSSGCNELIRTNVAAMITKADDLLELMGWQKDKKNKTVQKQLFLNLSAEEQTIINILQTKDSVHADELLHASDMTNSQLAGVLLGLEMQGLIKALPGKFYRTN
jgi:DNA processing protein